MNDISSSLVSSSLLTNISIATIDKSMEQATDLATDMLQDFNEANPVKAPRPVSGQVGHHMDIKA